VPMASEDNRTSNPLKVVNEPKGPKRSGDRGTMGDQALMDAIGIIIVAWLILFLLAGSLRRHNI